MFDSSRETTNEEIESHVPTQEQVTTANNKMGNARNVFRNMFLAMLTQLFD